MKKTQTVFSYCFESILERERERDNKPYCYPCSKELNLHGTINLDVAVAVSVRKKESNERLKMVGEARRRLNDTETKPIYRIRLSTTTCEEER